MDLAAEDVQEAKVELGVSSTSAKPNQAKSRTRQKEGLGKDGSKIRRNAPEECSTIQELVERKKRCRATVRRTLNDDR